MRLPAGSRGVPEWASKGVDNLRGLIPMSKAHYFGLATINNKLTEVLLDTAGARTMIDTNTARTLGLNVTWADKNSHIGTFSGVGGSTLKYAGVAKGPI